MGQRHKHADVIVAWANGAEIEYRPGPHERWSKSTSPGWQEDCEYRIKPPAKKYRVALLKDNIEFYALAVNNQAYAVIIEFRGDFVRWLTDWVEYEEKCGG